MNWLKSFILYFQLWLQNDYHTMSYHVNTDYKLITIPWPLKSTLISKFFPYHVLSYKLWLQIDCHTMSSTVNSDYKKITIPCPLILILITQWLTYHNEHVEDTTELLLIHGVARVTESLKSGVDYWLNKCLDLCWF
jgi:hypothetical protein